MDVVCVDVELYSWVHGTDLRCCGLGALVYCQYIVFLAIRLERAYDTHILSQMLLCHQKLRTQIVFGYYFMVEECKGTDACQHQVFGNLIGKSFGSD